MTEEPHQLLAKLAPAIARRFKAQLALDNTSYKDWLVARIEAYLAKPAAKASKSRPAAKPYPTKRAPARKKGGAK